MMVGDGEDEEPVHHVTMMPSMADAGKLAGGGDFLSNVRGAGNITLEGDKDEIQLDDKESMNDDDKMMTSVVDDGEMNVKGMMNKDDIQQRDVQNT